MEPASPSASSNNRAENPAAEPKAESSDLAVSANGSEPKTDNGTAGNGDGAAPSPGEWRSPAREVELPSASAAVSQILGDTWPPLFLDLKSGESGESDTAGGPVSNGAKDVGPPTQASKKQPDVKEPDTPHRAAKPSAAPYSVTMFTLTEMLKQFPIASILLILLAIALSIIGIIILSKQ
jgi:hypothetical protein